MSFFDSLSRLVPAALCASLAAAPAAADTFKAKYAVSILGLSIGTANYSASIDGGSYRTEANTKLSGLAALMSSSKGAATSTGSIAPGKVVSSSYATTSANGEVSRTVRMSFSGGNVTGADIAPPFEEKPGRVPLNASSKSGVIDPLSATLMPIPEGQPLVGPNVCNRSLPIFDGFVRFNVNLVYVGTRQVSTKGYKGPVSVCAARYVPLQGHRPDRPATKFMIDNKQMEVWLAPLERARIAVPYRISVATQIGTTVIEAQEMSVDGPVTASVAQ